MFETTPGPYPNTDPMSAERWASHAAVELDSAALTDGAHNARAAQAPAQHDFVIRRRRRRFRAQQVNGCPAFCNVTDEDPFFFVSLLSQFLNEPSKGV